MPPRALVTGWTAPAGRRRTQAGRQDDPRAVRRVKVDHAVPSKVAEHADAAAHDSEGCVTEAHVLLGGVQHPQGRPIWADSITLEEAQSGDGRRLVSLMVSAAVRRSGTMRGFAAGGSHGADQRAVRQQFRFTGTVHASVIHRLPIYALDPTREVLY